MTKLSQALQEYRKRAGFGIIDLARDLGVPRQTLEEWLYHDATPGPRYRSVLSAKFPGIFDGEFTMPSPAPREREVKKMLMVDEVEAKVKTHLAAHHVTALAALFEWFLFGSTAAERNQFRLTLGEQWRHFTNLAHAMIGEKAFEVLLSEGTLTDQGRS